MGLQGRKILIGITGSIAAYKIPFLIRLMVKQEAQVKILMTPSACDFVTPLTLATLSMNPVGIDPFDKASGQWHSHVDLANWADVMLFAPLSANTLAKMATGITDNLLTATYLAARCPVFFAPAMDVDMFKHPTTQQNIATLQSFGHTLIEPQVGELASGLCGEGRMEEPEKILNILIEHFQQSNSFAGKKVLITAGPTQEAIDPVRYIGNHSSGKMGFALAQVFAARGASVTLVTGPVTLSIHHPGVKRVDVVTAKEMHEKCMQLYRDMDIIIKAAAVADYRPSHIASGKIKKQEDTLHIGLEKTSDILYDIASTKLPGQVVVGFALETGDGEQNALAKLKNKNADIIVLNLASEEGSGFGVGTNKINIYDRNQQSRTFEMKPKADVARDIADYIFEFQAKNL